MVPKGGGGGGAVPNSTWLGGGGGGACAPGATLLRQGFSLHSIAIVGSFCRGCKIETRLDACLHGVI